MLFIVLVGSWRGREQIIETLNEEIIGHKQLNEKYMYKKHTYRVIYRQVYMLVHRYTCVSVVDLYVCVRVREYSHVHTSA